MVWPFARRAPIETKTDTSNVSDPEPWFGTLLTSGAVDASFVPSWQAAVRTISEACATLRVDLVRKGEQGEAIASHPGLDLLRGEANAWTSGFELIRDLVAQALTSDAGGLAWANKVSGKPAEIIRYDTGRITVQTDPNGTGEPTYRLNGTVLPIDTVIHVRGAFSKCPTTLAADAIAAAKSMELYARKLFENGARPGGVIEFPKTLGDDGLKRMKAAWKSAFGGSANAGQTAILWDGAKFTQMTLSSVDAQFLELRRFQVEEIARAFGISPTMLGDLTKSSYANAEQKQKEFLSYTLDPWLCALESAFNRALLNDDERKTLTFRFDRDDISRADLATRANAINSLIASETLNPNEGRDWIGLPPRVGGDVFANRNITVKPIQTGTSNAV
jgi:HK97 family phage portal protein